DNSETLLNQAGSEGASLFLKVLDELEKGTFTETEQDSTQATYCRLLEKEDGKIDWNQSAAQIDAKIRAFYPWPGAFTEANGNTLKIHRACVFEGDVNAVLAAAASATGKISIPGTVLSSDKKYGILVQTGNGILALQKLQWQTKKAMEWKDFLNGSKDFIGSNI
nr:methionyl-tRNA formyltransferase [Treponemataceae bacterium]